MTDKDVLSGTVGIVLLIIEWCNDILDENYQERVWIRQNGPEVDSFYDCSIMLSGNIDTLLVTDSNKEFTTQQKHMLQELYLYLEEVDVEHPDGSSRGGAQRPRTRLAKIKRHGPRPNSGVS